MFSNELQQKQSIVETNKGIWVSREILQMDLTPSEKLVYALLCQLSQMEKQAAYITNKQVSQITGIAETTVKNKIKPELRKLGLLQTVGIYNNVKHLKGDTKGMHLKGDTKGTPQDMHLKGDTKGMHLKGDGDMHLKGDRGCTQKVTQNNNEILQEDIKVTDSNYNEDTLSKQDVNIVKSDSYQSDSDAINNLTSNLELYVDDNTPDVPEWMNELPVTEPFVQYTDDIQGEAMQETTNNTFQADERENDPDPVTDKVNITSSWDEGIEEYNELFQADENDPDEPQENETSLNAALSDERLSSGEKIAETGAMDNNNPNKRNENMTIQERKQKQQELNQKWDNFKSQVNTMTQSDAETYFKRFLSKVGEYYTGTHIDTTQERYTREFNGLKPLMRHDWNAEKAKQIVQNAVNDYWEQERIERTLKNTFGQHVNRGWFESAIAEAKIKRDAERNTYKPDGDLPF